jgi:23S rRNA pseudouridine2457 synthase
LREKAGFQNTSLYKAVQPQRKLKSQALCVRGWWVQMLYRYILFNKPFGVVSQFSGEGNTLKDYIRVKDVYPVGRLDHDSEGLVLLTNDGALQHRLSDPKFEHPRTYWAQVERIPGEQALQQLATGVTIQGHRTRPAQVRLLSEDPVLPPRNPPVRFRKNVPTAWIELTLTEGRNRQVRRMTAAIGHPTLRLVRVAIGSLRLEGLQPGQSRELTSDEVRRLLALK